MALSKILPASQEQYAGARNLIINGAMQVAQRGTSFSQSPNSGGYHTVDRYSYRRTGTWSGVTAVTLTQESSGAPEGFKNFLRYAPVGSDATTPNNTTMKVQYHCEGLDAAHLAWGTSNAKAVTLSFYARSSVTGTFNVYISDDDPASTRTIQVKEYTINSANTWERKSLTFSAPTSGNWPIDNGKIFQIDWLVSGDNTGGAGVTVQSPDSWAVPTTDTVITSNQTDGVTTSSGQTWDITGIQLEVGDTATPFEHRSYGDELARCQRYFRKVVDGADTSTFMNFHAWSANECIGALNLGGPMRATPTMSVSSFGHFVMRSGGTDKTATSFSFAQASKSGFVRVETGSGGGLTTGFGAWLKADNSSAYLYADAEL